MGQIDRAKRRSAGPEKEFLRLFSETAPYRHRLELFHDIIDVFAIALHNPLYPDPDLENEYQRTISRYDEKDRLRIAELTACIVEALEVGPRDVLGSLFMNLELGNKHVGQFFTPFEVSRLMAAIQMGDITEKLKTQPFVSVSEPACGAGGMIMAVVDHLLTEGHDPAKVLFVQATDIDKTAARMCYIQLSLWNVPAEIVVGDVLRMEVRRVMYTPAYKLFGWAARLRESNTG